MSCEEVSLAPWGSVSDPEPGSGPWKDVPRLGSVAARVRPHWGNRIKAFPHSWSGGCIKMTYFHSDTVLSPLQNKSLPRRINVPKTPVLKPPSAPGGPAAAASPPPCRPSSYPWQRRTNVGVRAARLAFPFPDPVISAVSNAGASVPIASHSSTRHT